MRKRLEIQSKWTDTISEVCLSSGRRSGPQNEGHFSCIRQMPQYHPCDCTRGNKGNNLKNPRPSERQDNEGRTFSQHLTTSRRTRGTAAPGTRTTTSKKGGHATWFFRQLPLGCARTLPLAIRDRRARGRGYGNGRHAEALCCRAEAAVKASLGYDAIFVDAVLRNLSVLCYLLGLTRAPTVLQNVDDSVKVELTGLSTPIGTNNINIGDIILRAISVPFDSIPFVTTTPRSVALCVPLWLTAVSFTVVYVKNLSPSGSAPPPRYFHGVHSTSYCPAINRSIYACRF